MKERPLEYFLEDLRGEVRRPLHEVKLPLELFDLPNTNLAVKAPMTPVWRNLYSTPSNELGGSRPWTAFALAQTGPGHM